MKIFTIFILLNVFFFSACQTKVETEPIPISSETKQVANIPEKYQKAINAIEPFFKPMGKPEPFEWLATFPEEGQTFEQYINSNPTIPTEERKTLYIQPLGKFNENQRQVIKITAEYMQLFFNLPVKLLQEKKFNESLSLKNSRINPYSKQKQIRTGYVLEEVLQPALPKDAAALIAFTNEDLYPNENFNYVFGQASLQNRVGVWSLYRFAEKANFNNFLARTMKIGVHETGHIFSILHCTKYECVMSGTNHLGETDKRPIDACPECMAKICWIRKIEPKKRYENLAKFCKKNNLIKEAEEFERKAEAVR
jgi:archaemetzincin